tara:strand:+ start:397 stop:594 length:198 start_codon:yes stop_codon:yes gene_type:complete
MPRYKVKAEMITDLFIVVEAEDEEEAFEIADEIDGGDWVDEEKGDWRVCRAVKVSNDTQLVPEEY